MIFFKISTFYDVSKSNLPKPSWIKGQIACNCNIIFITLFRIKFFSVNTFFQAVHSLHSTVLSIAFTPSRFEAHGSSLYFPLIQSHIDYWGNCAKTHLSIIQKLQNRAAHFLTGIMITTFIPVLH